MHKDITIVTSLVGAGLEREYLLLRELLMQQGHYVMGVHYTDMTSAVHPSDIMISLEVVLPRTLNLSRENWLVPNCEWWDVRNDRWLPQFTKILCKTRDCYDIWCRKVGPEKCVYTGFISRDIFRPEIKRELRCLHVAGKSEHKNTLAVCRAWRMSNPLHLSQNLPAPGQFRAGPANVTEYDPLPPLTIVSRAPCFREQTTIPFPFPNVRWIEQASDEEIIQMMNSHMIHIIPSQYEGFGHVIHEGLSCGAMVLTTDAPPMNSYPGISELRIPSIRTVPRALAKLHEVGQQDINVQVRKAVDLLKSTEAPLTASLTTRMLWQAEQEKFVKTFMELVNGIPQRHMA